jgi:glycosyltransferase involved in cell wall biosynthesis
MALYKKLNISGHSVDFIIYKLHGIGNLWYKVWADDWFVDSCYKESIIEKEHIYDKNTYQDDNFQLPENSIQYIGQSIDNLYEVVIFSFPPVVISNPDIRIKKQIMLTFDFIANEVALSSGSNIDPVCWRWAYQHAMGLDYILKNKGFILSDSKKTDNEVVKFYNPRNHDFLPAFPQAAFMDVIYSDEIRKEEAIILAAPFDSRKGIQKMPKILNELIDEIDTVYIYGRARCGKEMYDNFYKELKIRNIVYYRDISGKDLVELYKRCKFLLFPSIEEGLGVPLIEAQVCGCRVITTNKNPMNTFSLDGSYLLTENIEFDTKIIKSMFNDNFDYKNLSENAKRIFSIDNAYKKLKKILYEFPE